MGFNQNEKFLSFLDACQSEGLDGFGGFKVAWGYVLFFKDTEV